MKKREKKGTKLEFVLFNRQNLVDQVPVALNWKIQGNQEQQTKHLQRPTSSKQHAIADFTPNTHC